jgi:hypothetical protein
LGNPKCLARLYPTFKNLAELNPSLLLLRPSFLNFFFFASVAFLQKGVNLGSFEGKTTKLGFSKKKRELLQKICTNIIERLEY